jgi:hypothetical protein
MRKEKHVGGVSLGLSLEFGVGSERKKSKSPRQE